MSLLEAGFGEEAREILNKAKMQSEVHPNVGSAIASLSVAEEQEEKKLKQKLKECNEKQRFLSKFSEAYFKPAQNADFAGQWKSSNGYEVNVMQNLNMLEFNWNENDKKIHIKGNIFNKAAILRDYTTSKGLLSGLLIENGERYALLLDDNQTILIMTMNSNEVISLSRNRV